MLLEKEKLLVGSNCFFSDRVSKDVLQRRHFEFDENGNKSSKRVENAVGKGEIAGWEQLLLF